MRKGENRSLDSAFYDTDLYIGKTTVSRIPGGGCVDVPVGFKYAGNVDGSPVYIIAVLDASNALMETDETNNTVVSDLLQ